MKNTKIFAVLAAAAVAAQGFAAFAQSPELFVGGNKVDAEVIVEAGAPLLPLRAVAESAGYEVSWIAESGTVIVKTDDGEVTLNPTAQMARSADGARIINDRTYVSVDFVNEISGLSCIQGEDGNINVEVLGEQASLVKNVTINEIGENMISINDEEIGEVILMISEDTKITKAGESITFSDIAKEDKLLVEYSPAMTMSLPPQTTAVSIEVISETVDFEGEITEITEEGFIIVKAEGDPYGIALIVSEDTQISHEKTKRIYKAEDLEVGMKVSGQHSAMMTRSLPPQTALISMIIK